MNLTYLITGSNIGNRKANLESAATLIEIRAGHIIKSSRIYETAAWGSTGQRPFYNQVHIVETLMPAEELIQVILKMEEQMGRIRTAKNAARNIDIDILFFNDDIVDTPYLTVPHKEIQNRNFVLAPMQELSPNLVHPVLKKPIHSLLEECKDPLGVKALSFSNKKNNLA